MNSRAQCKGILLTIIINIQKNIFGTQGTYQLFGNFYEL